MDKTSILKTRVSGALHDDFLVVCAAMGHTPAATIRSLIQRHVSENTYLLEGNVKVSIERPDKYEYGAWRVRISVRNPDEMQRNEAPILFKLPRLQSRRIHPNDGYRVAEPNWDGEGSGVAGIFVDGIFEGHLYSNGIEEDANPSSIEMVRSALHEAVQSAIDGGS